MPIMKGLAIFGLFYFRLIFEPQLEDPRISVLFFYFHLPVTARRQRTTLPFGIPSLPISWRRTYRASIDICKNQFLSFTCRVLRKVLTRMSINFITLWYWGQCD